MTDYDNTNTGVIFTNKKKTSDKHPDRTGSLNVDGVEYWLSGWIKKDKNGQPFMSLSIKAKEEKRAAPKPRRPMTDDHPGDPDEF